VRTQLLAASLAIIALVSCRKTDNGDLEVDRPVVGSEKDTIIVDKPVVGSEKDTIKTPKVEVGTTKDTVVITRPTVEVHDSN
jgi:hypothetical protein